jgi:tyrosyl-tRNA synthetase
LRDRLARDALSFYIGFDPTASSFHVGNLLPIMAMLHMQRAGHRPIVILGGGTAMVGDPSGKTEMRQLLSPETIAANAQALQQQVARYLNFEGEHAACMLNNADWLGELNYIAFLRDIGRHFSVNRMLTFEAYKQRLETGLSFLEFNYQLLQAYDFLVLYKTRHCMLQMGGDDQWGNMVAGVDLIRREVQGEAFAITFPLLTTATGQKMGKTADGAIWLDANLTTPYDFYQYWVNVDDRDVTRFLNYYTLLPLEEIRQLTTLQGADIRLAKQKLAFEVTALTHGKAAAQTAQDAAHAMFAGNGDASGVPETPIDRQRLAMGVLVVDLYVETGLTTSKSDARRLIRQGGARINGIKIQDVEATVDDNDFVQGVATLQAGKKRFHRVTLDNPADSTVNR